MIMYTKELCDTSRQCGFPVAVAEFNAHVKRMQADSDNLFKLEFDVSGYILCLW